MLRTKDLAFIGIFTAILIGGQLALSAISGVEIVTILLLSFSFAFGIKRSLFVANLFSILRCFVFGFFVDVLILYLIFYNIFVLTIGGLGNKFNHLATKKTFIVILIIALVLTVFFTMLSNVITPLYWGYNWQATKTYFYLSFTALIPQLISTTITVSLLFVPLNKIFLKFS